MFRSPDANRGFAAVAFLGALAAPSAQTALAQGKPGGTAVVVVQQAPRHLNPAVQSGIATAIPGAQIFASPLRFDEKWNARPYLAESWEVSKDGLTVTLKLVAGATFHDGRPITSEDVAFSIMTIRNNHPFQSMFAPVERVDTPDPRTAVLRLSRPHPGILYAMNPALCPIIPKHIFGDGRDPKTHPANAAPVGSGPYKVAEFKAGEYVVLQKYDKFFIPGRPYLDRIIVKIIPDMNNAGVAMERKEAHFWPFLPEVRIIDRLTKQAHLSVTPKGGEAIGPLNWLAFNTKKKPLDDVRVRQAISFAVDREFITRKLMGGRAQRATGPIVASSPFYNANVERYDVNLDRSRKLLDEAGYKPGAGGVRFPLAVDFIPGSQEQAQNIAEYMKPQLKKVGIEVTVRTSPDFPTWAKRISSFDFDITTDIVFNWGDPVIGVHRTYLCSNIRQGVIWSNTQQYCNPKVDELLASASQEIDVQKRNVFYQAFQKIIVDEVPLAFINVLPYHNVYDRNLRSIPLNIWGGVSPMDETYWEVQPKG